MSKQKTEKAKDIKREAVKSLSAKIASAKTLIFTEYHGLNVSQINNLRNKIKESGGELQVAKNTLLSRALLSTNYQLPTTDYHLAGPTAVIFAYDDEIAPLKAAHDLAKAQGLPKFKFGFFQKKLIQKDDIEELAQIPSRNVLEAKVVGAISSPLYGLVSVLSANIRNLVYVLDQAAKRA